MAFGFKDYYETLGVDRSASTEEIKKAYRKLARQHHPDRSAASGKSVSEERIKEINEAYAVLKDPKKRRRYDELGSRWEEQAGPEGAGAAYEPFGRYSQTGGGGEPEFHFGGTGFSDFFERFFGSAGFDFGSDRSQERSSTNRTRAGLDVETDLMVTLEEVVRGSVRPISLRIVDPRSGDETVQSFNVRIPAGAEDGQRLRVRGKGARGRGSSTAGDLYLRIAYAPHPEFRVDGSDLYYDLEVAPWEAVLGAKIDVPALDGSLRVTLPPGTPHGRRMRLGGRGLPRGRSGAKGDLFVVVSVGIPSTLSSGERELWRRLAAESSFRPRS